MTALLTSCFVLTVLSEAMECESFHHDIQEFYDGIKMVQSGMQFNDPVSLTDIRQAGLNVSLRPYQQDAVGWMLHRERRGRRHVDVTNGSNFTADGDMHPLFRRIVSLCGKVLYYNRHNARYLFQSNPIR